MKKLEEIQSRKVISAYGGSGSVIETLNNGSLLIEPYDKWFCFSNRQINNLSTINNPRLLAEVQKKYPNAERLVEIPKPELEERKYVANNGDLAQTISTRYFPEWFYCPRCRRLKKIGDWKKSWNLDKNFGKNVPACPHCSKKNGTKIKRQPLEQIRFVMASFDSGKLMDIPFDKLWGDLPRNTKFWIMDNEAPTTDELTYNTSQGGDGLQSIYIKKGQDKRFLSTIYNKYLVYTQGGGKGAYRVLLRNGSDLYYPNILSCIYIPTLDPQAIDRITKLLLKFSPQEVYDGNLAGDVSLRQIEDVQKSITNIGSTDFRMEEFNYITNQSIYNPRTNKRFERDFKAIHYPNLKSNKIKGFYALTQLKETSVLMSYSRVSSGEKKWWDVDLGAEVDNKQPGYTLPFEHITATTPNFMPAMDSFGEGILFELDVDGIPEGYRETFAHTYCHLIMKQLEFLCGYPVTSIKERLYFDGNIMGFLIYTIQGSEGSYGGLTSLLPNDTSSDGSHNDVKLLKVLEMAIERAKDCPNDPICSEDEEHPGHCFACVDLPETSCECFNNGLNRKVFLNYIKPSNTNITPSVNQTGEKTEIISDSMPSKDNIEDVILDL